MPIVLVIPTEFKSRLVTIGYENFAEGAAITSTSTDIGFDENFVGLWTLHDAWKAVGSANERLTFDIGGPETVNYLGLAGHNLGSTGANITFESGDTINGPWTTRIDGNPTNDDALLIRFQDAISQFWRLTVVTATSAPVIALSAFGKAFEVTRGVSPGFQPPLVDNLEIENSESRQSLFIGRSVTKFPQTMRLNFELLDQNYVRNEWVPFLRHAQQKPFFLAWNALDFEDEVVYAWTQQTDFPSYQDVINMRAPLLINGLRNVD